MTRYINVTLIDDRGQFTSTQLMTSDDRAGLDYMESEQAARNGRGRNNRPLIAAFIYDTRDGSLKHYIIDGLRARIVTKEMFA
jgi:hypothetical protein